MTTLSAKIRETSTASKFLFSPQYSQTTSIWPCSSKAALDSFSPSIFRTSSTFWLEQRQRKSTARDLCTRTSSSAKSLPSNSRPLPVRSFVESVFIKKFNRFQSSSHNEKKIFATSGGTVEVLNNKVIVLAETFENPEDIDTQRAEEAIKRAKKRIAKETEEKDIDIIRAELALRRAINRLKLAKKI